VRRHICKEEDGRNIRVNLFSLVLVLLVRRLNLMLIWSWMICGGQEWVSEAFVICGDDSMILFDVPIISYSMKYVLLSDAIGYYY
jgi:hypothetical protein